MPAFVHSEASFTKIAEGYGCKAFKASSDRQLRDCMQLALEIDGPVIIEVPIYYPKDYPKEDVQRLSNSSNLA